MRVIYKSTRMAQPAGINGRTGSGKATRASLTHGQFDGNTNGNAGLSHHPSRQLLVTRAATRNFAEPETGVRGGPLQFGVDTWWRTRSHQQWAAACSRWGPRIWGDIEEFTDAHSEPEFRVPRDAVCDTCPHSIRCRWMITPATVVSARSVPPRTSGPLIRGPRSCQCRRERKYLVTTIPARPFRCAACGLGRDGGGCQRTR